MGWLKRVAAIARLRQSERELADELRHHIDLKAQEFIDSGMSPEEARYAALRTIGGVEQKKEQCRDADRPRWLEDVIQDVKYGLRQLRRNPGFTAVAVLTLALGIGATSAIFSVVNGVLLKPLPYPHPNQLVSVSCAAPSIKEMHLGMSASIYFVYRDNSRTFRDISLYDYHSVTVTGMTQPEVVPALDVTEELLPTLGVRPILGRAFTPADGRPSSPRTVMLAFWYWQKRFGGNRSVVGKTIETDGTLREIIGVLPKSFQFLDEPDIALVLPIRLDRAKTHLGGFGYGGIARLRPGFTLAEADADASRMLPIVARSFPPPSRFSLKMYESVRLLPHVKPLKDEIVSNTLGAPRVRAVSAAGPRMDS